jgi:hypothetical protein
VFAAFTCNHSFALRKSRSMESSASFCANPSICSLACKRSMLISRFCEKLSRMSRSALLRCGCGRNKSGRHQAAAQYDPS